jgi:hypothetical protein
MKSLPTSRLLSLCTILVAGCRSAGPITVNLDRGSTAVTWCVVETVRSGGPPGEIRSWSKNGLLNLVISEPTDVRIYDGLTNWLCSMRISDDGYKVISRGPDGLPPVADSVEDLWRQAATYKIPPDGRIQLAQLVGNASAK